MQDQMVDYQKRRTLMVLASGTVAATLPSLAMSSSNYTDSTSAANASQYATELEVTLTLGDEPTVSIRNHSERLIIVQHIYPGTVNVEGKTFDLNELFERSASAVGAGRARRFKIRSTVASTVERKFPNGLIGSKPIGLRVLSAGANPTELLNTRRQFFYDQKSLLPVINSKVAFA